MDKKKIVNWLVILGILFITLGIGINLRQQAKPKVEIIKKAVKIDNLVNINTADLGELDTLPGIGPKTAQKIIDYRINHGGFKSIDEIKNVSGIGPKKYADLVTKISL